MNETNPITVPEEEIFTALQNSIDIYLPVLIMQYNMLFGENWVKPPASVLCCYEEKEQKPLPLMQIHLDRVKKKSSDPFVEMGEYLLTLECRFERDAPEFSSYRYAALIQEWFASDQIMTSTFDRYILEEVRTIPQANNKAIGYPEAIYIIRIFKDRVK